MPRGHRYTNPVKFRQAKSRAAAKQSKKMVKGAGSLFKLMFKLLLCPFMLMKCVFIDLPLALFRKKE